MLQSPQFMVKDFFFWGGAHIISSPILEYHKANSRHHIDFPMNILIHSVKWEGFLTKKQKTKQKTNHGANIVLKPVTWTRYKFNLVSEMIGHDPNKVIHWVWFQISLCNTSVGYHSEDVGHCLRFFFVAMTKYSDKSAIPGYCGLFSL